MINSFAVGVGRKDFKFQAPALAMAKLLSYYQGNDTKKPSGGYRPRPYKVKRKALGGGPPTNTRLSNKEVRKLERTYGGNVKVKLYEAMYANVCDPKTGKCEKARILKIVENPANREFVKRGIITRGTVIETDKGRAVVVSRPGQDGTVNAVLLK